VAICAKNNCAIKSAHSHGEDKYHIYLVLYKSEMGIWTPLTPQRYCNAHSQILKNK